MARIHHNVAHASRHAYTVLNYQQNAHFANLYTTYTTTHVT